jgi:hypothetical protein
VTTGMLVFALGLSALLAQSQPPKPLGQQEAQGKEVALTGRIVDLHCFMTGSQPDKDLARCTQKCLRGGVPAALETESGLVILGKGMMGIGREASRHALSMVEISGKLYERHGLKYVDVTSIKEARKVEPEEPEEEGQEEGEEESPEPNEP